MKKNLNLINKLKNKSTIYNKNKYNKIILVKADLEYENENYSKCIELYKSLINDKMLSIAARIGLTKVYLNINNLNEAKVHIEFLLKSKIETYEFKIIYGFYLELNKKYDLALLEFQKATSLRNKPIEAYNNLGAIYKLIKNYNESLRNYETALSLNPENYISLINIGNLYLDLGEIEKSIFYFRKIISIYPKNHEAFFWLAQSMIYDDNLNEAYALLKIASQTSRLDLKIKSISNKCVIDYLNGNELKNYITQSDLNNIKNKSTIKNSIIYYNLIINLYKYKNEICRNNTKLIYVIGESHTLSIKDLILTIDKKDCSTLIKWIPGLKIFHLISESNRYKYLFGKILNKIPRHSTVLIFAGEIDCRYDEGIFNYCLKNNLDTYSYTEKFILKYLDVIEKLTSELDLNFIVTGIAARSNKYLSKVNYNADYIKFIAYFNELLKFHTQHKKIKLLNLFDLTAKSDGTAIDSFYIDDIHLTPDTYLYALNFESFITQKKQHFFHLQGMSQGEIMPTLKIDNKEYDLDTLSDECKAQLASIQFVEQELVRLQAKAAALQTAKAAYLQALKNSLPVVGGSDTIKLS